MDARLVQFARGFYFELQTIEGVKPLEIWSGFREIQDSYEKAGLIKNLYKIVVTLVNERCYGRPFSEHSRLSYETVGAVVRGFTADLDAALFQRFPWPPTGDAEQKELYQVVKTRAAAFLAEIDQVPVRGKPGHDVPRREFDPGAVPDDLFDFSEMRIVDNELPYIIFTDKEFRVIHGMTIVYLWLLDLDALVLRSLEDFNTDAALIEACRAVGRKVQRENPLIVNGIRLGTRELISLIQERVRKEDYLDLFESVYSWFDLTRQKMLG
jgi:hypothetical protein